MAFWLRAIINHVYSATSVSDCRPVKIKAHEVLIIASLVLFRKNFCSRSLELGSARQHLPHSSFGTSHASLWTPFKGLKATNEWRDNGIGILHQVAQYSIDQVYLYARRPCPSPPTQDLERQGTWLQSR